MATLDDFIGQTSLGQATTTAALVLALDKAGSLPRDAYCRELRRLWREMPKDAAEGPAGTVIEEMLDLLEPAENVAAKHQHTAAEAVPTLKQTG